MPDIYSIDLKNRIPGGGGIEFLRAETSAKRRTPFVLVWYTLDGIELKTGLRLDLDKRSFLDHFEEPEREETALRAARLISEYVGDFLYRRGPFAGIPLPSGNESLKS